MLRDLQNYVADQTEISAQDMNTLGQAVKIINGITGPDVFKDATGIAFRQRHALSGGIDVYQGSTIVLEAAERIGVSGISNTSGVLEYEVISISGEDVAELNFKTSGVPDYAVLGVVSGNVVFDYPRVN